MEGDLLVPPSYESVYVPDSWSVSWELKTLSVWMAVSLSVYGGGCGGQSESSLVYFRAKRPPGLSPITGDLRWASIYLTIAPLSRILTTLSSNSKKWIFKAGFEDLLHIWSSNTNKLKYPFPSRITSDLSENMKCTESVPRMGCVSHIHFSPHLNPKSVAAKRTMNKDLGDLNASLGSVTDFAVAQEKSFHFSGLLFPLQWQRWPHLTP